MYQEITVKKLNNLRRLEAELGQHFIWRDLLEIFGPPLWEWTDIDDASDDSETLLLKKLEKKAILTALRKTSYCQLKAAALLGISPWALNYKIKLHGIKNPQWKKHI